MIISRKYEVQSQLGRGSMGVVYKVRHVTLDTISALKVLPPQLVGVPELVKRFHREARVVARLQHPNIVRVIDIDQDDALQFHYFVMEYIQGQTLREYLKKRGPLPFLEVLKIARQIAQALEYAHSYTPPVIHRDIKPSNIMIEEGSGRVVVMDFGIAKELGESELTLTKAGTTLGTVKYCPPEQLRHQPLDGSVDVYALGMVMYEAYTGAHYFAGLGEHEVIDRVLDPGCENKPHFARPAPDKFIALVTKAIAKSRDKRYRGMTDLLRDLETCFPIQSGEEAILDLAPINAEPLPEEMRDDLKELEDQIHKLEQERQRRLVAKLQVQAREAREQAAREGAGQLALALFQQGLAQEESGLEHLSRRQYSLAQQAYGEAISLYAQAYEKASAVALIQRAEHAQQRMMAVKGEADHYGAAERAAEFYRQGLVLQAQAEELWERQAYEEAARVYEQAQSVFEEVRDLAYRTLLEEEIQVAQDQMNVARELALRERTEEFAPQAFQQALLTEQRANMAVDAEEFTQARELYRTACQQYQLAEQQANTERRRQQALVMRPQAHEARHEAEAPDANSQSGLDRQAAEAQGRGKVGLQGQEDEQADREYTQAEALHCYEQSAQSFLQLSLETLLEVGREEAQAIRQRVFQARESVQGLRRWAETLWAEAQSWEIQAEQAYQAQEYEQAIKDFEQAYQAYERARLQAEQQRYHQQVLVIQQEAAQSREAAEEARAQQYAQELYQHAIEAQQQGNQNLAATRWEAAIEAFVHARELFGESLRCAKRIQARQAAEAGRESALAAYQEVQENHRAGLFPERCAEAVALLREGEQRLRQEDPETAHAFFERSAVLFRQIGQEAVGSLQKEQADPAQVYARGGQRQTSGTGSWHWRGAYKRVIGQKARLFQQGNSVKVQARYKQTPPFFAALQERVPLSLSKRKRTLISLAFRVSGLALIAGIILLLIVHRTPRETTSEIEPPVVNAGPIITWSNPELRGEIAIAEGQTQTFAIKAQGPRRSPLRHVWFLNGKQQAEGERWSYQPDFTEAEAKPKEIKVVVTDSQGHRVERVWQVRVHDTNRPPQINKASPPETELRTIPAGGVQHFSVEATDPDQDDPLVYAWFLDGQKVASHRRWRFHAPLSEGRHRVMVEVLDKGGLKARRAWNVVVQAPLLAPEITEVHPQDDRVTTYTGQSLDFSVTADIPGGAARPGKMLRYEWSMDNNPPSVTETGHFHLVEGKPGTHRLSVVAVSQEGLKSAPRNWVVEVLTPPQQVRASPPQFRSQPRQLHPQPRPAGIRKAEVLNWLETYRRAWEEKNVDTLVELGEVTSRHAPKLREVLLGYKDLQVALEDVQIRIRDSQATVTLTRVDTMDSKTLAQPNRKVFVLERKHFVLEKQADGRLVRRMMQ